MRCNRVLKGIVVYGSVGLLLASNVVLVMGAEADERNAVLAYGLVVGLGLALIWKLSTLMRWLWNVFGWFMYWTGDCHAERGDAHMYMMSTLTCGFGITGMCLNAMALMMFTPRMWKRGGARLARFMISIWFTDMFYRMASRANVDFGEVVGVRLSEVTVQMQSLGWGMVIANELHSWMVGVLSVVQMVLPESPTLCRTSIDGAFSGDMRACDEMAASTSFGYYLGAFAVVYWLFSSVWVASTMFGFNDYSEKNMTSFVPGYSGYTMRVVGLWYMMSGASREGWGASYRVGVM